MKNKKFVGSLLYWIIFLFVTYVLTSVLIDTVDPKSNYSDSFVDEPLRFIGITLVMSIVSGFLCYKLTKWTENNAKNN